MTTFDNHSILAISTIADAPTPATSGLTLTVAAGEGAHFAVTAGMPCTIVAAGQMPTSANAEIARITGRAGDVLTIERAQEGSTARAVQVGDVIFASITPKTLTDIENALNAASGVVPGSYINADLTVDAQGRVTNASNGTGGGAASVVNSFPLSPAEGDEIILTAPDTNWPPGRYIYHSDTWVNERYPSMAINTIGFTFSGAVDAFPPLFAFVTPAFVTWDDGYATNGALVLRPDFFELTGSVPSGSHTIHVAPEGPIILDLVGQLHISSMPALDLTAVTFSGCSNIDTLIAPATVTSFDLTSMTTLRVCDVSQNSLTSIDISHCSLLKVIYLDLNNLSVSQVNAALVALDGFGLTNGFVDVHNQTPAAPPSGAGAAAVTSLVSKGWSVTTD